MPLYSDRAKAGTSIHPLSTASSKPPPLGLGFRSMSRRIGSDIHMPATASTAGRRLRLMLDHFARVGDPREACKVKYPLGEVLFLVTCATIAGCDDYV